MVDFPPVPQEIKPVAHLLKLAEEHDDRNIVVAYWARMSACLLALRLVPGKKSPESAELIGKLLSWLEETKKANHDNDGITNETSAQALIEDYALRLFEHGDQQDKAEVFNKNTVKTFYTAGMLMDVLEQFGTIPDDIREKRKYAKWKAAYIHTCLKAGERPLPGPPRGANDEGSIVHNSTLSEEELATYTKYTGPMPFTAEDKPHSPNSPPEENYGLPSLDLVAHPPGLPYCPSPIVPPQPSTDLLPTSDSGEQVAITPEMIQKAQKYCKFATSALTFDDIKNATENLHKALNLLQRGREQ